jgi:hypothetical protein
MMSLQQTLPNKKTATPNELQAAEAAVAALAGEIRQKSEQQRQEWLRRLREEQLGPHADLLRQIADAHRQVAADTGLAANVDVGRRELWQRLVAYRAAVRDEVILPLSERLEERLPGDQIATGFVDYLQSLALLSQGAPDALVLPEPPDLYEFQSGDDLLLRQRKILRRLRRATGQAGSGVRRMFGKTASSFPVSKGREVKLRHLLDHHLGGRVPQASIAIYEAFQQRAALTFSAVEDAFAVWMDHIVRIENRLDKPAFHEPPDLVWPLSASNPGAAAEEAVLQETAEQVTALVQRLQRALDQAADTDLTNIDSEIGRKAHEEAHQELVWDLDHAGTFRLRLRDRSVSTRREQVALVIRASRRAWSQWYGQVVNRFILYGHILALREQWIMLENKLLSRIADEALHPLLDVFTDLIRRMEEVRVKALAACERAAEVGDGSGAAEALKRYQEQLDRLIQEILNKAPSLIASLDTLSQPARPEEQEFSRYVDGLPATLEVHPVGASQGDTVMPGLQSRTVSLPQVARHAMMAPLSERLEERANKLRTQVIHVWSQTEQVQYTVQYHLSTAVEELARASTAGSLADEQAVGAQALSTESGSPGAASELVSEGLTHAADRLAELSTTLWPPWQALAEAAHSAILRDFTDFYEHVESDEVGESPWHRSGRQIEHGWEHSKEAVRELESNVLQIVREGRQNVEALVRKRIDGVGAGISEEERLGTLDAIAQARALHASLPLIYRKLFTFEPLAEPLLLAGRRENLALYQRHYERWLSLQPAGAVVVPLPLGSGRTSLLNVLEQTSFTSATVFCISLDERLRDSAQFAEQVARALGVNMGDDRSLEALEARLIAQPRSAIPVVCMVDNLEHLMLRVLNGTQLFERVLIFFSRTAARIFWVATIDAQAWKYAEKTAAGTSGLVNAIPASPLSREDMENLILLRHRNSGLILRFAEPRDGAAALLQRLGKAHTPEERQRVLRADYFDRLYEASGQNITLALFYWLRSADFGAEPDVLTVRPLRPLNFGFLDALDPARAFTLQAFNQHNTLTVREHNEIFRLDDAQSMAILESLLNMYLIEPVTPLVRFSGAADMAHIRPTEHYRLSRLMLHPIREMLRSRYMME